MTRRAAEKVEAVIDGLLAEKDERFFDSRMRMVKAILYKLLYLNASEKRQLIRLCLTCHDGAE